ncbi:MAG: dihydroorotase [Candidatus Dadabacteria bacterium]|nr:MAG: dihydroorotase [Candidatus Dadabacteria bacterium]
MLIRGGTVVDPANARHERADVLIADGRIAAVDRPGAIPSEGCEVIDATGQIVAPGFVDMHVHLREPGYEYKETVATGCMAAVAGGVTSVACMPNTNPVNDNGAVTKYIIDKAALARLANVFPIGAVSVGLAGERLAEFGEMHEAGIVAVSDDGRPIMNSALMRRALEYARMFGFPVIAHEEDLHLCEGGVMHEGLTSIRLGVRGLPSAGEAVMVARDIELVRCTGGRLHVAHVSTAEAVEMIRRAKEEGLAVTAEATPHHFTLDERAVEGFNTNAKMYPPLRSRRDVAAVQRGLADGTSDAIATDHAPHHRDEKGVEFDRAAFGVVGLETSLPLALDLVRKGILDLSRMIEAMSLAPARILGIERGTLSVGAVADVVIFDPEREWRVEAAKLTSKGKNTPFDGWTMKGRATRTIVGGRSVWRGDA